MRWPGRAAPRGVHVPTACDLLLCTPWCITLKTNVYCAKSFIWTDTGQRRGWHRACLSPVPRESRGCLAAIRGAKTFNGLKLIIMPLFFLLCFVFNLNPVRRVKNSTASFGKICWVCWSLGIYTTVAVALIKKKSSHDRNYSYALTFHCNNRSTKTQSSLCSALHGPRAKGSKSCGYLVVLLDGPAQ